MISVNTFVSSRWNTYSFATCFWCYHIYPCHWESLDIFVTVRGKCFSVWWTSYQLPGASIMPIRQALGVPMPTFMLLKRKPATSAVIHGSSATVYWNIYQFLGTLSTREVFHDTAIPHGETYFHYWCWAISKLDWSYTRDSDDKIYHITNITFSILLFITYGYISFSAD